MLKLIGDFFGSILKSIFMSGIMFVIFYSIVTRKFPPDFSQISKTYDSLQQMVQLNKQISLQKKTIRDETQQGKDVSEEDVEQLQEYYQKQADLGMKVLGSDAVGGKSALAKNEMTEAGAKLDSIQGNDNTSKEIKELRMQLMHLQTDLDELKEEVRKKKR